MQFAVGCGGRLIWKCLFLYLAVWAGQGLAAEVVLVKEFEALAAKATVFDTEGLLFGHSPLAADSSVKSSELEQNKVFQKLVQQSKRQDLESLLAHSDARVRLLVLGALFAKEDILALPKIAELTWEDTETLPMPGDQPQAYRIGEEIKPPPPKKQTVGQAARMMLERYIRSAGYRYDIQGTTYDADFKFYWEKYRSFEYTTSWFAVQLNRAMLGSRPPGKGRQTEIQNVRSRIDLLPEPERIWVLLGLRAEYEDYDEGFGPAYANMFASREELLVGLKKLGPDRILSFLRHEAVTKDPDFQSDGYPYYQNAAKNFILKNPTTIFRPEDADLLVAQGKRELEASDIKNPFISAWWWVAAAQLCQERAGDILVEGFEILHSSKLVGERDVLLIIQKMWEMSSESASEVTRMWFFDSEKQSKYDSTRRDFVRDAVQAKGNSSQKILAMLLLDPKAVSMKSDVLAEFAVAINTWLPKPLVSPDELELMRGRWGKGLKREENGPQMVPGMLERLQASVPHWKK